MGGSQVDVPMGDKHPNWGISPNACENEEDSTEIHFGENLVTMYSGDFLSMGTTPSRHWNYLSKMKVEKRILESTKIVLLIQLSHP